MSSAFFARIRGVTIPLRTRHTANGDPLPAPRVVVVVPADRHEEGWFLIRYAAGGIFGGDTWHATADEARAQAESEYQGMIDDWRTVPPEEPDAVACALRFVERHPG
jgi:hypothetical protein